MSQRGLPKRLIDLVCEFGEKQGDKFILNKKSTQKMINELDSIRKGLLKIMDKGGITVVVNDDALITVYNTNSYRRN
jgi:hypothetical protein